MSTRQQQQRDYWTSRRRYGTGSNVRGPSGTYVAPADIGATHPDAMTESLDWSYQNPDTNFYTGTPTTSPTSPSSPSRSNTSGYRRGGGGGGGGGVTQANIWNREDMLRQQDRNWMLDDRGQERNWMLDDRGASWSREDQIRNLLWGREDGMRDEDRDWMLEDRDAVWGREDRLTQEELKRRQDRARLMSGMMQQLLGSDAFQARGFSSERNALAEAVAADEGRLNTAMDDAAGELQGVANPYNQFAARATQVEPGLAGLLESQGQNAAQYRGEVANTNAQGKQQADAFNNTRQALAAAFAENQASRGREIEQTRNYGAQNISNQNRELSTLLDARSREEQEAMRMQRLQAIMQMIPMLGDAGGGEFNLSQLLGGR